jgi:cell division protein ZapA (FtsZ GTPase activity inhibitor)
VDDDKNYLCVDIMGVKYRLKRTEDENYLREVAGRVDACMRELYEKYPVLSSDRIAVLAALRMCDEYNKETEDMKRKEDDAESVVNELTSYLKRALKQ